MGERGPLVPMVLLWPPRWVNRVLAGAEGGGSGRRVWELWGPVRLALLCQRRLVLAWPLESRSEPETSMGSPCCCRTPQLPVEEGASR